MVSNFRLVSATGSEPTATPSVTTYGYLETNGNDIVDAATGEAVRLVGANWFGGEGYTRVPNGLWARNYKDMMDDMVDAGFNALRVPISPALLDSAKLYSGINKDLNPDLFGKTALEIMDSIVDYAGKIGLRIVLDMHRIDPGVGKQESGLWFSDDYSFAELRQDWKTIVNHYNDNPTIVGVDLFNEPSGPAHWAEDGPAKYDWHKAATTLGNDVLSVNPNLLVFVEGNHTYENKWYWVGGQLKGVKNDPIELNVDDRVVYSPHDYPYTVQYVPWLKGATSNQILNNFKTHWGYIQEQDIAPIVIGETGGRLLSNTGDKKYFDTLFTYLENQIANSPGGTGGPGLFWWGWNPNSGDTGGLLRNDWSTIDQNKLAYLDRIAADTLPTNYKAGLYEQLPTLTFTIEMDHNSWTSRVYNYKVKSGTAIEGKDFVARDGVLHYRPGQTLADIDITILPDQISENNETVIIDIFYLDGKKATTLAGTIKNTENQGNQTQTTQTQQEGQTEAVSNNSQVEGSSSTTQSSQETTQNSTNTNTSTTQSSDPAPQPASTQATSSSTTSPTTTSQTTDKTVKYFADHKVVLTSKAVDADTYNVSAVLTSKDGGKLGDWDLRVDPDTASKLQLSAANGQYNIEYKADGAVKFSPAKWAHINDTKAVINFTVDVGGTNNVVTGNNSSIALEWDATRFGQGTGVSETDGTQTDSGSWLDVNFDVKHTWGVKFFAKVEITNTSNKAISDWILKLKGQGFKIDEAHKVNDWMADGALHVSRPYWDKVLDAGETIAFGINGTSYKGPISSSGTDNTISVNSDTILDQFDVLMV